MKWIPYFCTENRIVSSHFMWFCRYTHWIRRLNVEFIRCYIHICNIGFVILCGPHLEEIASAHRVMNVCVRYTVVKFFNFSFPFCHCPYFDVCLCRTTPEKSENGEVREKEKKNKMRKYRNESESYCVISWCQCKCKHKLTQWWKKTVEWSASQWYCIIYVC